MEPIKPPYLQRWEELARCTFNRQPIIERIRENSSDFFRELHESFDQWASLSPRTTNILQRLVPTLHASFEEAELHEKPLDELLMRLINKGNEDQILVFLGELEKNKVLKQILSPIHLQCAYQNQLVRVTLEIIMKKGFLNHCFENDQTQLHLACKYNMPEVAERLCSLNIDKKEKQDALGNTALHLVSQLVEEGKGMKDIGESFIEKMHEEGIDISRSIVNMQDECKMCLDEITPETGVMYKLNKMDNFKNFDYCISCLTLLMDTQWMKYIKDIKNADCEKSLVNLIKAKPPINFRDNRIEENKEIYEFFCDGKNYSAKLKGSFDAEMRDRLYNKLLCVANSINKENVELKDVPTNENVEKFDYLERVNKVLKEFDL